MKNKIMIEEVMQESNETFFSLLGMEVILMKDAQEHIPLLAQWIYDEFRGYDLTLTKEKMIDAFSNRLRDNGLPLTLVVIKESKPIAMISLKEKGEPEFSELAEGNPWIGSLFVVPEERNKGIGQELLNMVITIGDHMGYQRAFVYTSKPEKNSWYLKNGAQQIESRPFRGHKITIFSFPLY